MFNLPVEIQRYIYEFCGDKWVALDKVLNQLIKGGFNRKNYNIKKFIKNENKKAIKAFGYSKVTKLLFNIGRFENIHPEFATYLNEHERQIKIGFALENRKKVLLHKIHISNENIRADKFMIKIRSNMELICKSHYFYGQVLHLPINALRVGAGVNGWEEDNIDCDICTCEITNIYGTYNGFHKGEMRFDEDVVKSSINVMVRLLFDNGNVRYYTDEYLKQRLELSKHFGINNKLSWYGVGYVALPIIKVGNREYLYDEKGMTTDIKNLVFDETEKAVGIYDKKINEIILCEFEEY